MSLIAATDDDDRLATGHEGREHAERPRGAATRRASASSQSAWFGLAEDGPPTSGVYAGLVFNRPIEQVLTYRVPVRLAGLIRVGQLGAARPWGRGGQAGGRLLRAGRPRGARGARPDADQGRGRDPRPAPVDRREDARADAMAGRILRLLLGPGAGRGRAGGREEARGDAGRDVPRRPGGDARGPARRVDRAEALGETGVRPRNPLPGDEPSATADVCRLAKCSSVPVQAAC